MTEIGSVTRSQEYVGSTGLLWLPLSIKISLCVHMSPKYEQAYCKENIKLLSIVMLVNLLISLDKNPKCKKTSKGKSPNAPDMAVICICKKNT